MSDDDILKEAREAFTECDNRERDNRLIAEDDIRFARLLEHWPQEIEAKRLRDGRPCLKVDKLGGVIRQVVNDARQNRPQIKVQPQDSGADPETAEIYSGLIRNIELSSDADVAYDTAVEHAVSGGFGYFRVNTRYACDDNWDQDLVIERVSNPFSVYGDPYSTAADSSDWDVSFVTDRMSKKAFERQWKEGAQVDWESADFPDHWCEGDDIIVAEYWKREKVSKRIYLLSNGEVIDGETLKANQEAIYAAGVTVQGSPREVPTYKVTQRTLNGVEVLSTVEWAGKYIPIVPVYGDEINLKGKRHFRSLIHAAKDAQRMFNYWRSTATELVALAPKAPFIGPKGAFETDAAKWETANVESHPYIEFDGQVPPQRQPFAGVPAGVLQEALNASDDIKAITGIYDASLGARSNETSGRAILVRQHEGDTSTFHFADNLTRAIRHGGRILIDLIPHVYNTERIVRVLGAEGEAQSVPLNQPITINGVERVFDLAAGKYDLTVTAGPSYNTRREEAADQMIQFVQAFPPAAPVLGDLIAKHLDWPGADEVARRLQSLLPPQIQGQEDPQAAQAQQAQAQQAQADHALNVAKAQSDAQTKQADSQVKQMQLVSDANLEARKLEIEAFRAETERMRAMHEISQPTERPRPDEAA